MRFWSCLVAMTLAPNFVHAQTSDVCGLLARNSSWTADLKVAQDKWRVTPGTMLAVLDQESRLRATARGTGATGSNPSRNFGYAQANIRTWNWYLRDTGQVSGSRTDFALSADFIGWHFATMERRIGASRDNTTAHYLAYKMGEGGYKRGASAGARALANRIAARARGFDAQLGDCGF